MSLALAGARGVEQIARRWAAQKGVRVVLARPAFARRGRAAPFRANDQLLALEPVCVLALPRSLASTAGDAAFGLALSLLQEAARRGVRTLSLRPKPA